MRDIRQSNRPQIPAIIALVAMTIGLAGCRQSDRAEPGGSAAVENVKSASAASRIEGVPEWFPVYRGARVEEVRTQRRPPYTYTQMRIHIPTNCKDAALWYIENFRRVGLDATDPSHFRDGCLPDVPAQLGASGAHNNPRVRMTGGRESTADTSAYFNVDISERADPDRKNLIASELPSWIPRYPGSTPLHIVADKTGITYDFVTNDAAGQVNRFFQDALKPPEYRFTGETNMDARHATLKAYGNHRMLNIRVEPIGDRGVIVYIEANDFTPTEPRRVRPPRTDAE